MTQNNFKLLGLGEKLTELVNKTYEFLDKSENASTKEELKKELENLKDRSEVRIAFVGQYSSGKSTIISALTGNKDIKIDANVATDVVTEYKWNNVVLLDTPGILAGKVEKHDQRTKEALQSCDLIVYVLTSQLFDDVMFDNFIDLAYDQKLKDKMLIAINKMSMENGEFDELVENYSESINIIFKERGYKFDFDVVFIDAADYIEGKEDEDEEFVQMSNFRTFVSTLNDFVNKKGILKKQFDTPIRILKSKLSDVAISEADPNLQNLLKQYTLRLIKSKQDIKRKTAILLNQLEQDICLKGLEVSVIIGEKSEEEFEIENIQLNHFIEERINQITKSIEEDVNIEYQHLSEEMDAFLEKDTFVLYFDSLNKQLENPSISVTEKANIQNQKRVLGFLKDGGTKLASMSSNTIEGAKGLSAASGSQMHLMVKNVGHIFGHKFKPWGAIKIADKIGKIGKIGIPVVTAGLSIWLEIYNEKQEEKKRIQISNAKKQYNAAISSHVADIKSKINSEIESIIINNYNEKLSDLENMKLDLVNEEKKESLFRQNLETLNTEYVDFIETIEKT